MTIRKQFVLVFTIVLVTILANVFFVFQMTNSQDTNKTIDKTANIAVVNLAERQRMLIQKYSKEYIDELISLQVYHSTLKAAAIVTLQITEDRRQYTKNVIGKLKKEVPEVHPNHNYALINGSIPLPTTFLKEVSEVINQKGIYSYGLLSKWNINKEKGLATEFEKEAFDYLYNKKEKVYSRFLAHRGLYTLRYATPDVASAETCVQCHNAHEDSPKSDFKLGDVMGILVVNIPIGTVSAKTEAFFAGLQDKGFGTDSFLKTRIAFDMTLDALINGGKAPLDLEMTKFTTLPPTRDFKIKSKLNEVKQLWDTVQENTKKLTEVETYSAEYIAAYDDAYISANVAMKAMNKAVNMYPVYSTNSEEITKMATLSWVQCGSIGVVVLIIILGWLFFKETSAKPIQSSDKVESKTKRISEQPSSLMPKKKKHNAYNFNREDSLASLQKLMKSSRS